MFGVAGTAAGANVVDFGVLVDVHAASPRAVVGGSGDVAIVLVDVVVVAAGCVVVVVAFGAAARLVAFSPPRLRAALHDMSRSALGSQFEILPTLRSIPSIWRTPGPSP